MRNWFAKHLIRQYTVRELPGWGRVYRIFVGGYEENPVWAEAAPTIIRDKLCGYYRIVDLREWADRTLYFLGRWYDLKAALLVKEFVKAGQNVVDVGANYGHFSMAAAKSVGPTGQVISFEPNPTSFSRLQTHVALNRISQIRPIEMGISDQPAELMLKVPNINSGEASFTESQYEDSREVTCRVDALDNILGDIMVHFIKIDVEGFECNVLKGALELIRRCRPLILTEVVDLHLERAGSSRSDMMTIMQCMDYIPVSIMLLRSWRLHQISLSPMTQGQFNEHPSDNDVLWLPVEKVDDVLRSRRLSG